VGEQRRRAPRRRVAVVPGQASVHAAQLGHGRPQRHKHPREGVVRGAAGSAHQADDRQLLGDQARAHEHRTAHHHERAAVDVYQQGGRQRRRGGHARPHGDEPTGGLPQRLPQEVRVVLHLGVARVLQLQVEHHAVVDSDGAISRHPVDLHLGHRIVPGDERPEVL
jgi:hypothetical protein